MACQITNGTVVFGVILANYVGTANNYAGTPNPAYSSAQIAALTDPSTTKAQAVEIMAQAANPPFTEEELAIMLDPNTPFEIYKQLGEDHNCNITVSSGSTGYGPIDYNDPRSNVYISGIEQFPDYQELKGPWWYTVNDNEILSYDLEVSPALV
jgi:hypothetical protein